MSADIFFENDRTKYTGTEPEANPVEAAAAMVITLDPYVGMTLGEIWKKDVNFIKWLRDDPNISKEIKDAVKTINAAHKRK